MFRFPSHPSWRACVLAGLLLPALAVAAQGAWRARLGLESGVDTNATREYQKFGPTGGAMLNGVGSVEGEVQGERGWAGGSYDVGGRKFLGAAHTEDTLVQAAQVEGALSLSSLLQVGVEAHAKDRRGGSRAYTDLTGAGVLTLVPDAQLELRLRMGGHRFLYREYFGTSFGAFESGLQLRYRIDRRHSLSAGGELGTRRYHDGVRLRDAVALDGSRRREDGVMGVSAGYSYRGPFSLSAGYSYLAQQSNSFGETVLRHRLSLSGGLRLPWEVTALGQAVLQWAAFPDGAYYSSDAILAQDDETLSSLTLKLARPLGPRLDVELRYALYGATFVEHELSYLRQVASVGLTWRL